MRRPLGIIFDVAPLPPTRSRSRRHEAVPERYDGSWTRSLLFIDAVMALCAALLVLPPPERLPALGFTAILLAIFAVLGLYARSFAVEPRDEVYAVAVACAVTLLPTVAFFLAVGVSLERALGALGIAAVAIALSRTMLTAARRGRPGTESRFAGVDFIGADAAERSQSLVFRASQRAFDLIVALIGTIVLAPVMLLIAIVVFLDSGAPVLFRQERVGRNGRSFEILKFRTMRPGSEGNWARPGDRRITRVGQFLRRTSLDELPQLFNVIAGDMSIVGPRPEMRSFAEDFKHTIPHYDERHFLKPGITGWAQIYLKRNLDPSEIPTVAPYDLFYVQHACAFLNAVIVLKTAVEVVFHRAV